MGCFNLTCQMSQLPICAGDKVRFFLLLKNPYAEDKEACYSADFWMPISIPILAEYNDYGSIEGWDKDSLSMQAFMYSYQRSVVECGVGENKCHDLEVKKTDNFERILETAWEGRIKFRKAQDMSPLDKEELETLDKLMPETLRLNGVTATKESPVSTNHQPVVQAMIREDVYQHMLTLDTSERWRPMTFNPTKMYEDALAWYAKEPNLNSSFVSVVRQHDNPLDNYVRWMDKQQRHQKFDMTDPKVQEMLKDFTDFHFISYVASSMRHTWHPQCGAGGQDAGWELARDFHKGVAAIADQIKLAQDIEYGDDDEDTVD